MSNLTDALIAAKLMGNGGGGGGSGLPEITTETVTILPEQSITLSDVGGGLYYASISGQFPIAAGATITTIWDGVSYDCAVNDFNGVLAWGNLSILGRGDDTGEPFVMIDSNGSEIDIGTKSTEASHTVEAFSSSQTPADGSIMQVVNGAWRPVVPPSGGTEVLPFIVRFSLKIDQAITKNSSSTVTLDFLTNNLPDTWNTAAGLSCYIKSGNTIHGLVLLKVELDLSTKKAVATILNPLANDQTIGSGDEMYGYAIKLT